MHDCIPFKARADLRRRKVTEAARKLFAAKGFHNTGVAEIAAVSDVRVGQIYRDFPSKEAIVAAIVEADFAAFVDTDSLRLAIEQGDRDAVLAAIERMFEPSRCAEMMPEIMAEAARNPRIAGIIGNLDDRFRAVLSGALAVFAPGDAMLTRRDEVAEVIMVLVVGLCQRAIVGASFSDPLRVVITREIETLAAEARSVRGFRRCGFRSLASGTRATTLTRVD